MYKENRNLCSLDSSLYLGGMMRRVHFLFGLVVVGATLLTLTFFRIIHVPVWLWPLFLFAAALISFLDLTAKAKR